jgi:hypothetical protein
MCPPCLGAHTRVRPYEKFCSLPWGAILVSFLFPTRPQRSIFALLCPSRPGGVFLEISLLDRFLGILHPDGLDPDIDRGRKALAGQKRYCQDEGHGRHDGSHQLSSSLTGTRGMIIIECKGDTNLIGLGGVQVKFVIPAKRGWTGCSEPCRSGLTNPAKCS